MTRQKKSRKIGQIGTRKQDARPTEPTSTRRKKAPKGQKSGHRNSLIEETTNSSVAKATSEKKDPKLGSKKKIDLVKQPQVDTKPKVEPKHSSSQPKVKLEKVTPQALAPEQELAELESDTRLIELAERADRGELLTGKDAKYFNQKMNRYDELVALLGLETDEPAIDQSELDPLEQLAADQWNDLRDEEV